MDEQEDFFSQNHLRLLNIAWWAKHLAWVVLIVYILWAVGTYVQEQNYFFYYRDFGDQIQYQGFMDFLRQVPSYGFSLLIEMISVFVRGVVYFLVLKGISLGLNMIVETDINYREQESEAE